MKVMCVGLAQHPFFTAEFVMFMYDTPLDLLKPGDPQVGIIRYSAYCMCSLPRNYLHVHTGWKFSRTQKYYSPCEKCAKVLGLVDSIWF